MNDDVLDPAAIAALRELSTPEDDVLAHVQELFERDGEVLLGQLREAVSRGDAEEVWKLAHELRSLAGNVGAQRLAALCDEVQEQGLAGALPTLPPLEREFERARAALHRL
jgi:HPt (histidine-containing phosphotransfer) domain-containing protein